MRKIGVFTLTLLVVFSLTIVFAADNETSSNTTTTSSVSEELDNSEKIDLAYECLEDEISGKCDDLSIQEVALSILATPSKAIFDECVEELQDRERSGDCYGTSSCNVKETAMAILALDHAGKDTEELVDWVLEQNATPTDLIWYIQEDSVGSTECTLSYDADDYKISVGEDKKISANAGSCLTRAQSNFWLQIDDDCFDEEFKVSCNKDFMANLIYKNKNKQTIYVLDKTDFQPAYGDISLKVKSSCFGDGKSCDYESTAWATLALLKVGVDVENYIPYVIAMSESNERYLPNAFTYAITGFDDYANSLIKDQQLGDYWLADSSAYGKYYDTALALLVLDDSSADQVINARNWATFSQDSDGCWRNSIRDTAIMLWALEGRGGYASTGTTTTTCSEGGFYCISSDECPSAETLENYFCSGLSTVCCEKENLKTCEAYGGQECATGLVCSGKERKSLDVEDCCQAECEEAKTTTECESKFYSCQTSCFSNQEPKSLSCSSSQVCCGAKTTKESSNWWIWVLTILILIVVGILIWMYREKIRMFYDKMKSKKDKGSQSPAQQQGGLPPSPGFPPVRRAPMQQQMPRVPPQGMRPPMRPAGNPQMDQTFQRLRQMSR